MPYLMIGIHLQRLLQSWWIQRRCSSYPAVFGVCSYYFSTCYIGSLKIKILLSPLFPQPMFLTCRLLIFPFSTAERAVSLLIPLSPHIYAHSFFPLISLNQYKQKEGRNPMEVSLCPRPFFSPLPPNMLSILTNRDGRQLRSC